MRHRAAIGVLLALSSCGPGPGPSIIEIMAAEDRRAASSADLATIRAGVEAADPELRAVAVRALGRLEKPRDLEVLAAALEDPDARVRATAAWALAQSVSRGAGTGTIVSLARALQDDPQPRVRAAAATSLGRLHFATATELSDTLEALLAIPGANVAPSTAQAADTSAETVLLGVARGLESLVRLNAAQLPATDGLARRLRAMLGYTGIDPLTGARVRALALGALSRLGPLPDDLLRRALGDSEAEVRRLAATAAGAVEEPSQRDLLLDRGSTDPDPHVRLAALQTAPGEASEADCRRIMKALQDPGPHVRLRALDLAARCPAAAPPLLRIAASAAAGTDDGWHAPAHALVAIAHLDPQRAAVLTTTARDAPTWQTRMYAGRAAVILGDAVTLEQLTHDPVANVREQALRGLHELIGHQADAACIEALAASDPQLLIAAATCLTESSAGSAALEPLLAALARLTAGEQETSRDARMALLERINDLGTSATSERLQPYLRDFDPRIAGRAAEIMHDLSGGSFTATPQPLPRAPFPTYAQLEEIAAAQATLRMRGGGEIMLRLLPWDAPTNAARFVDLARRGALDGLTFHRVVANFVIQGASPGANEFAGHGAYTRDELTARSHLRGTVGISTRGHDTGDGQIFINLVDNVRLDHAFTIFAEVVGGYDTLDAVLEGAVIESVEVKPAPAAAQ